jgi:hypothetical protein
VAAPAEESPPPADAAENAPALRPPDPATRVPESPWKAPTLATTPGGNEFPFTHAVPARGMPAWATPDPTFPAVATLDPWLPVQVVEWWGEWAHIRCSNGWEAWVNGRLLVSP